MEGDDGGHTQFCGEIAQCVRWRNVTTHCQRANCSLRSDSQKQNGTKSPLTFVTDLPKSSRNYDNILIVVNKAIRDDTHGRLAVKVSTATDTVWLHLDIQ